MLLRRVPGLMLLSALCFLGCGSASSGGGTDADADTDADGDGDADSDGDTDADTDTDGDGDADTDSDGDSDADSDLDIDIPTDFDAHSECPQWDIYGDGPPDESICDGPSDPLNKPPHPMERWFTEEVFDNLFPKANLGWGGHKCWPFSYQAFILAVRYFPRFADEHFTADPDGNPHDPAYTKKEMVLRDLAAFLSHAIQETGENQQWIYDQVNGDVELGHKCFYRGGFYNWFEGGPDTNFLPTVEHGYEPEGGDTCLANGVYCSVDTPEQEFFYPCNEETSGGNTIGCYFGRGAIQISYNYNYGQFGKWCRDMGITHHGEPIDLLKEPNLVVTKMDPPLAVMASLWFYMTPQPPKPAMHDIIVGNWVANDTNKQNGFYGPILGPTSLIINKECTGEDPDPIGGGGESRRIKAFKFFSDLFGVPAGTQESLSCNGMVPVDGAQSEFQLPDQKLSFVYDWNTPEGQPCDCFGATYPGIIPYMDERAFPHLTELNPALKTYCEDMLNQGWPAEGAEHCEGLGD